MASRDPRHLHPMLYDKYLAFMQKCDEAGIDVIVTCTYRSPEEQDELYAQGRTKPGSKVTNAKAGQSKHNFELHGGPASKAFDVAIKANGKITWDTKHPHWKEIGVIGQRLGLTWGGAWTKFKDYPHFEIA